MILGGIIYIIFRDNNTLMFSWFYKLGIAENIENIRNVIEINFLPNWILFNFPDGVWIYSLTSLMFIIWENTKNKIKYFWIILAPVLGISAELGQYINIVPGTYDYLDLSFCIFASIMPFLIFNKKGGEHYFEKNHI